MHNTQILAKTVKKIVWYFLYFLFYLYFDVEWNTCILIHNIFWYIFFFLDLFILCIAFRDCISHKGYMQFCPKVSQVQINLLYKFVLYKLIYIYIYAQIIFIFHEYIYLHIRKQALGIRVTELIFNF